MSVLRVYLKEVAGLPCLTDKDGKILLKGGFETRGDTDLYEDSPVQSATLLCNWHLSTFDVDPLERIAIAEKRRFDRNVPRSYQREFKPVVAVLSCSTEFLEDFSETYGGLMDLVPLAIDSLQRDSLDISGTDGLHIRFERYSPIDTTLCNLCRRCAFLCEQDAISPELTIDPSKCNLCGKCVGACEAKALDLYRKEVVNIRADAVVLDGSSGFPLSEERPDNVYFHDELIEFFRKIGIFDIEEVVEYDLEYCGYDARLGVGCNRCVKVCPVKAIVQADKGIIIDHESCVECGECISACPTGALEYARLSDREFCLYFDSLLLPKGIDIVIFTQEVARRFWWAHPEKRFSNTFFWVHPCPEALCSFHLLYLAAMGVGRVLIVAEGSSGSFLAKGSGFVNDLLNDCLKRPFVELVSEDVLDDMLIRSGDGSFVDLGDGDGSRLMQHGWENRRKGLVFLMAMLMDAGIVKRGRRLLGEDFVSLSIGDDCTLCLACLNVCYQGAMDADESKMALMFNPSYCIACNACVDICPEGVLCITGETVLDDDFFSAAIIKADEPVKCRRCGKVFGNRMSFEHVLGTLSQSGVLSQSEAEMLYLCEDCRAVAILERLMK